ncbi:hypothetical protein Angca_007385 [Angiostrongylus cantonensis]|nr:hypothetical protein Angca_007385 [Angiostrongylus cantonensis]
MQSDKKKSMGAARWSVSSSAMKTPTRPRFTIGGTQISSSSKTNVGSRGQARFSISGAVPASVRRHSAFRSITCAVKDTRPLSSKEYQNEMIRKIYDFLLQHDGENCVPERVIRSPTKQDFIYMFESIYQHLSPNLQIRNVHEEVPAIFRELGYPTAIRPSTMQTIGASHTWPNLLGALTWLIEVVEYKYSWLNAGFKDYQRNRNAVNNEGFFDDKIRTLRTWCEEQEDFDAQQDVIQAALEQIKEECAELEANKGSLESLREDIAQLDDDISKATHYKEETERDVNRLAEENVCLQMVPLTIFCVAKTMSEGQSRLAELEELAKVQEESSGLGSNEARELMAEFEQNKLTMRKLKDELDCLCKQHWLAVPKSKRAFAEQHDRYHKLMLSIKNFDNFAHCEDAFMMDDNVEDERALRAAVSNVKALVETIETGFVQRKWDMAQVIRQFTFELEPIKQEYNVVCGKLRQRQRMESRADRQRERDREDWNKDLMAAEADLARLENEKDVLEDKRHEIDSLKRDVERQKAANLDQSKLLAEKQSKISEEVSSRFHLIVSDLDKMNEARDWMMRTMKGLCDIKFPTDEGFLED